MGMEVQREALLLDCPMQRERTQVLVEGDVILPDSKPDAATIVRSEGRVRLSEVRPADGRVSFSGALDLAILYQTEEGRNDMATVAASLPFSDVITAEGVNQNSQVRLTPVLEHLDCRLQNDRKFSVRGVVTVWMVVYGQQTLEPVAQIEGVPGLQTRTRNQTVNRRALEEQETIPVAVELTIPANSPAIQKLLDADATFADAELRPQEGRVQLTGTLRVTAMYQGDDEEAGLETVEAEFPVNGVIEDRVITADMPLTGQVTVESVDLEVTSDENGEDRILTGQVLLNADLTLWEEEETQLLEDAYSLSTPIELQRETATFPVLVGRIENRAVIRDTLSLPADQPDLMQVSRTWGTLSLNEPVVSEDMVTVDGVVQVQVLYITADDQAPRQLAEMNLPFTQEIQVKGAAPGQEAQVTGNIENLSCQSISARELECRANVLLRGLVTAQEELEYIADVQEGDAAQKCGGANVVLYVVQKGDTLWSIAKRYNTTVRALTQLNDIENPDLIYPGQKLLILRKTT